MKTLTNYTKNQHDFTMLYRAGMLAIFHGRSKTNGSETWEVIDIQSHNGREISGTLCEPAEYPPSNEQWGSKGWTCTTEAAARERFRMVMDGKELV